MSRRGPISPPHNLTDARAAPDRPARAGHPTFADAAPLLLKHGYEPLPIRPRGKAPVPNRWSAGPIDVDRVHQWCRQFPDCGVGIRTGHPVGIDIDLLDEEAAHDAEKRVRAVLRDTPLLRVGLWPKRLLLCRALVPFPKLSAGGIEVLARGQQLVAFGIHPTSGKAYYWPSGETPLEVPLGKLPLVDEAMCRDLLGVRGAPPERADTNRRKAAPRAPGPTGPVRDERGLVVDGRDAWLSSVAYHVLHDALDAGRPIDAGGLAAEAWSRFTATADLARARKDGTLRYGPADAFRKVEDKLRLHREGRLPPRQDAVEATYQAPTLSAEEARAALDWMLGDACRAIENWHETQDGPAPQIGIRATVGLGKSVRGRSHVLAMRERLLRQGRPSRVVVVTPSLALAEEAAVGWRTSGLQVAVLRGYHAKHPSGEPMCRDTDAVDIAVQAGIDVHASVCRTRGGQTCPFIERCLKQENLREVAAADVVIAAYDALFTGFAGETDDIGIVIVDEGCWRRAEKEHDPLSLDQLTLGMAGSLRPRAGFDPDADMADLHALRRQLHAALSPCEGAVTRKGLLSAGVTEDMCRLAASLEERLVRNPKLRPGMEEALRKMPRRVAAMNARARTFVALWNALADLLASGAERNGRVCVELDTSQVVVRGVKPVHPSLAAKPVLHLDATLRPELARTVLPHLRTEEVEAAAPHMSLTLVSGSFGKGMLCPPRCLTSDEAKRRANRRRECVDYVRWQAARVAPGRVLVVTYKTIEREFASIPNVSVAHFNAIAGLDAYRDVRLLMVIGRPLPSDISLGSLAGAFLAHAPTNGAGYRKVTRGVRMRDGTSRAVDVIEHSDAKAELLRAAICDDEVIQAIGRGRGVNRALETPLDVHVLADVALPLVHDRVVQWEAVKPDIVQRMLLEGVAVDSPADAAMLHYALFSSEKQAQKALDRDGFKRQTPIRDLYREMSLKSAAYRRSGRGRSWQRAYWLSGPSDAIRNRLVAALGDLAEWKPHSE